MHKIDDHPKNRIRLTTDLTAIISEIVMSTTLTLSGANPGSILAKRHAGRFRVVRYAELRATATRVAVQILAEHVATFENVVIAPILMGGGLPGRLVIDALLPYGVVADVTPCRIQRYSAVGVTTNTEITIGLVAGSVASKTVIGVDDLVDGGETMAAFIEHAHAAGAAVVKTAVMYAKPGSTVKPDYVGEQGITQWLVLPGEEHDFMHTIKQSDPDVGSLSNSATVVYFHELGFDKITVQEWSVMPRFTQSV